MTVTEHETAAAETPVPAPDPATVVRALSCRFPRWTIWWGESTARYWGMSRRPDGGFVYVEAASAQEFVHWARDIDSRAS
ncbi:hypothetical protein [Acrocarpospora catenulata]|uniref:hypothetical protein n=1 Tax=Acrocarpospora catenulata TaxID=2836182 RepID=UPI001BDB414E|nr:hypothetical protein [Acrocarpospora catenulata]